MEVKVREDHIWFDSLQPKNKVYDVPELPKCYFEITINKEKVGRIVFTFYRQTIKTYENFR
jgi:hypothetical protein